MQKNDPRSLAALTASMLIFGTIGIFRTYIPLSSALLAFSRGIMGSLFLLIFTLIKGKKVTVSIGVKKVLLLALSGAIMGINWMLLFEAYNYTSVATATLCYYMEPTIVILLSPVFFKEKLTGKKLICALIAIIGMVFVSGLLDSGGTSGTGFKGIVFGLGAACFYSAVVMLNKKLSGVDAYEKTVIQLISAALVLLPYLLLTGGFASIEINTTIIIMLLIVGLIHTGLAYVLYFGSINGLKTQTVALFSYIDPVTALILSALILSQPMSIWGIIGAVLIIGAAVFSELDLHSKPA